MTRFAYAVVGWLLLPLALVRLGWRARKQSGYLERIGERIGRYDPVPEAPRIWIHAVSVGETRAAAPLVEHFLANDPGTRVLLTHMTATGRATGVELFGDRVERAWLPWDLRFAARRFLAHYRPHLGIVMETELWPHVLDEARRAGIPVALANARLSERSAARYARFPSLTRWTLGNLAGIAAQSQADADRFAALGASPPVVTGNIKFDFALPAHPADAGAAFRARFGDKRGIVVAGSTRDGEESLLLDAFAAMPPSRTLLAIVPRHPQRFDDVAALARSRGFTVARRSEESPVGEDVRVLVGDSMGEMLAYYGAADVVIMGGSLLDFGSQNLIEPAAMGKPVIVGPSTYNFEDASKGAIAAGGALRVRDAAAAMAAAQALLDDGARRAAMGEAAKRFAAANRGALERLVRWLEAIRARARG